MSRSPEGYGSSASGLIHLAAKGVEKTTNDLSLSLTTTVFEARKLPRSLVYLLLIQPLQRHSLPGACPNLRTLGLVRDGGRGKIVQKLVMAIDAGHLGHLEKLELSSCSLGSDRVRLMMNKVVEMKGVFKGLRELFPEGLRSARWRWSGAGTSYKCQSIPSS